MFVLALFLNDVDAIRINGFYNTPRLVQEGRIDLSQPINFVSQKDIEED